MRPTQTNSAARSAETYTQSGKPAQQDAAKPRALFSASNSHAKPQPRVGSRRSRSELRIRTRPDPGLRFRNLARDLIARG